MDQRQAVVVEVPCKAATLLVDLTEVVDFPMELTLVLIYCMKVNFPFFCPWVLQEYQCFTFYISCVIIHWHWYEYDRK